jgi:hypothetical protein
MSWKVVKIIDSQRLVINAGSRNTLTKGQKLVVYVPGDEVLDPDTQESLGTLDTIKCYIEVADVFEKMSICKNAEIDDIRMNFGLAIGAAFRYQNKNLPIDAEDISGGLKPISRIKVGDLVKIAL